MKNKYFKFILGTALLSLGITLNVRANFGADPLTTACVGLCDIFNLSLGVINLFMSGSQIVIGYILEKRNVTVFTFLSVLLVSLFIEITGFIIPVGTSLIYRIICLFFGVMLYAFGIAYQQGVNIGYNNYDVAVFGVMKVTKIKSYKVVRWIFDGIYLVIGFILGSTIGVGTVVVLLFTGILVELFVKLLKK